MPKQQWSKFKKRVEALWADDLDMVIHCTAYRHSTNHDSYEIPRFWVVLNGNTIWDFPGPFIEDTNTGRLPDIRYWLDNQSFASFVLREYLDLPRDKLFEPIHQYDQWELGDILRAADRRIGKNRLLEWAKTLDEENPARKVIEARFGRKI